MSIYIYVAIAIQVYAFIWFVSLLHLSRTTGRVLNPFNVKLALREFVGVVVRRVRGFPTFSREMNVWVAFRLDRNTASVRDVEQQAGRLIAMMRAMYWAYPQSQRDVIVHFAKEASRYAVLRDMLEQMGRRERSRSYHSGARQQSSRSGASSRQAATSTWRQVLGVSATERDMSVIKTAYRKLAQSAHPDRGGSDAAMSRLNQAIAQARAELSST